MPPLSGNAEKILNLLQHPELDGSILSDPYLGKKLSELKTDAISRNDQDEASRVWCIEKIAEVQRAFIEAFSKLKNGEFYNAWCQFERCEIELKNLQRHHTTSTEDPHRLNYIYRMISRWQSIYPYRIFFSPEFLKKKILCSICGCAVTPRSQCEHEKGNLYNGESCHHIIAEVEILGISVVKNPVQRYSVAFISDEDGKRHDHYNYDELKFVTDRVSSPFHEWKPEQTTRIIHSSDVSHLDPDSPCPCTSGEKFSQCCSGRTEITIPHLMIEFSVPPPSGLPNQLLSL